MTKASKQKKTRAILLGLYYAGCLLAVAVSMFVLLASYATDLWIERNKKEIEAKVSELFSDTQAVQTSIESISFATNILKTHLHLKNIMVFSKNQDAEMLSISDAYVELSFEMFSDTRQLPLKVIVVKPRLLIKRLKDGSLQVAGINLAPGIDNSHPKPILPGRVTLEDAEVAFVDETGQYPSLDLQNIDLDLQFDQQRLLAALSAETENTSGGKLLLEIDTQTLLNSGDEGGEFHFELHAPSISHGFFSFSSESLKAFGVGTVRNGSIELKLDGLMEQGHLSLPGMNYESSRGILEGTLQASFEKDTYAVNVDSSLLRIELKDAVANMQGAMRHPVPMSSLKASVVLSGSFEHWSADIPVAVASNPDVKVAVTASFRGYGDEISHMDMIARSFGTLSHDKVHKYLPALADDEVAAWLELALVGGQIYPLTATVRGYPGDAPFANGETGAFRLAIPFKEADFNYWPDWPSISKASGVLTFEGKTMALDLESAFLHGIDIGGSSAQIPDLLVFDEQLHVDLQGQAAGNDLLAVIAAIPPLAEKRIADQLTLGGETLASVKIILPIRHNEDLSVDGDIRLNDSLIGLSNQSFVGELPFEMSNVNAYLKFNESKATVSAQGTLVGKSASLSATLGIDSWESFLEISDVSAKDWLRKADLETFAEGVQGNATVRVEKSSGGPTILSSKLVGVGIDLPTPLGKVQNEKAPLTVILHQDGSIGANYRDGLLKVRMSDSQTLIGLNQNPPGEGFAEEIVVRGTLQNISLDSWLALTGGKMENGLSSINASLAITDAVVFERPNSWFRVKMLTTPEGEISVSIDGEHVAGSAMLQEPDGETVINADFKRVRIGSDKKEDEVNESHRLQEEPRINFPDLPRIVFISENVMIGRKNYGKVLIEGAPLGSRWMLEKLTAENHGNRMTATGYSTIRGVPKTEIRFEMEITDLGSLMSDWGAHEANVNEGTASLNGTLSWDSSLLDPSIGTMHGKISLAANDTRLTKVDTGLFSILRLLTPDTFLSLGFTENLRDGLLFETIRANFRITKGIMDTDNFEAEADDINFKFSGQADLDNETLDFKGRIQPGIVAINALLGVTAIASGSSSALIGWLGGKIFEEPLSAIKKQFSEIGAYEYTITGKWDDPIYTEIKQN